MQMLCRTGLPALSKNTHKPVTPLLDISPTEVHGCSPKTCPRSTQWHLDVFPNWKLPECAAAERRNILYDHTTQCDKGMDMNNQLLHATAQELSLTQH